MKFCAINKSYSERGQTPTFAGTPHAKEQRAANLKTAVHMCGASAHTLIIGAAHPWVQTALQARVRSGNGDPKQRLEPSKQCSPRTRTQFNAPNQDIGTSR
jgi:hypothetical protein